MLARIENRLRKQDNMRICGTNPLSKTIYFLLLLAVSTISILAQGRINFSSEGAGVALKFILPTEHPLGPVSLTASLSQFRADLFWTPGSTTVGVLSSDLTNQCNYNQAFQSTVSHAGFFAGGVKTVAGWVSGPIVAQIRVWDTSFGNYATARQSPLAAWYETPPFIITPTLTPTAAATMLLGTATCTLIMNPEVPYPFVRAQPQNRRAVAGSTTGFGSEVWGISPFYYQWHFNQSPISGGANGTLQITNAGPANVGNYWFVVTNLYGSATSQVAVLDVVTTLDISTVPAVSINGAVGVSYRLEYIETFGSVSNWTELATFTLTNTPQVYLDYSAIGQPSRFYRVLEQP